MLGVLSTAQSGSMQPAERSRALHISWIQICEPMPRILHGEVSVRLHTTPKTGQRAFG
jgi:hypothetical protein